MELPYDSGFPGGSVIKRPPANTEDTGQGKKKKKKKNQRVKVLLGIANSQKEGTTVSGRWKGWVQANRTRNMAIVSCSYEYFDRSYVTP